MWLVRESSPNQVTLPLTQVGCKQLTGGQQEAKFYNIAEPPGKREVQRPFRNQLNNQLYQSQGSL